MRRSKAEELFRAYLEELHTTLWGRSFDVVKPELRDDAVKWFLDTCEQAGIIKPDKLQTRYGRMRIDRSLTSWENTGITAEAPLFIGTKPDTDPTEFLFQLAAPGEGLTLPEYFNYSGPLYFYGAIGAEWSIFYGNNRGAPGGQLVHYVLTDDWAV